MRKPKISLVIVRTGYRGDVRARFIVLNYFGYRTTHYSLQQAFAFLETIHLGIL